MQETSKNKDTRYRCDHCKKLIQKKDEHKMIEIDGTLYSAFDDRFYHYCNRSQWDKAFSKAYQLRLALVE